MAACNPLSILLELFARGSKCGNVDISTLVIASAISAETKALGKYKRSRDGYFSRINMQTRREGIWDATTAMRTTFPQHSELISAIFYISSHYSGLDEIRVLL